MRLVPKRKTLLTSLIVVLLFVNTYILLHRNEGYRYFPFKTYSELYVTDSTLYLENLVFNADSVQLILSMPVTSPYVLQVDTNKTASPIILYPKENTITLPLANGIHTYHLTNTNADGLPIDVTIDHSCLPGSPDITNEFNYCSLPGPHIKVASINDYKTGITLFSQEEINKGKKILQEKTRFYQQVSDSGRVMELAKFVAGLCNNPKGLSFIQMGMLSPPHQLDAALQCRGQLVCGNYTSILLYLASVGNLCNRGVSYTGSIDKWQYGAHYVTEVYLHDKQQWVLLDAVNNIYLPHDSTGRYLNIADIKKMVQTNGTHGKLAYSYKNGKLAEMPYDSLNAPHYYYNKSNASLLYAKPNTRIKTGFLNAIIDFYCFDDKFCMYSDANANDWGKIILKEAALILLVASVVGLLASWKSRVKSQKSINI